MKLFCIDAGHGLHTAGKRCMKAIDPKETREWSLNSRIASKLQELLKDYDCQTMRMDDPTGQTDVPLATRVAKANQAKADAYLSIHHNAGVDGVQAAASWYLWATKLTRLPRSCKRRSMTIRWR